MLDFVSGRPTLQCTFSIYISMSAVAPPITCACPFRAQREATEMLIYIKRDEPILSYFACLVGATLL